MSEARLNLNSEVKDWNYDVLIKNQHVARIYFNFGKSGTAFFILLRSKRITLFEGVNIGIEAQSSTGG